mmetsp:Transcript_6596/g.15384  ORF Transcript_6596/g.15384 Transcript_6596/m.15384 type:complete len:298 (-) Transcript_6596:339-1232(-)
MRLLTTIIASLAVTAVSFTPSPLRVPLGRAQVQASIKLVAEPQNIVPYDVLPAGWMTGVDQGQTYYYNEQTGQTQWEPPLGASSTQTANHDGWTTGVDHATGQTYYFNEMTGQSQWDPPQAMGQAQPQQAAGGRSQWDIPQGLKGVDLWQLGAFNGVIGFSGVAGFAGERKSPHFQKELINEGRPCQLPYTLKIGDEQVLSRWNMAEQALTVSREQCSVKCSSDGTATLTSTGKGATLWSSNGAPWVALRKDDEVPLADGDLISLDCNNPDGAIFMCQSLGAGGAAQHGGFAQHGGY